MGVQVKVFGSKGFDDAVVVFIVDENGTEKGPFCINAAGEGSF